jgi:hypothetical protein
MNMTDKEMRAKAMELAAASKLEQLREIKARKRRPPGPPNYKKAKALLIAKFAEHGRQSPDDAYLSLLLDKALDTEPQDGPSCVDSPGLGPANADWAEVAFWIHLDPQGRTDEYWDLHPQGPRGGCCCRTDE